MLIFGGLGIIYLYFNPGDPTNYLARGWVWPSLHVWFWILVQAVFSLIGIGFIMKAYLIGEVTYVSIFEYLMLIFAVLTAWLVFGHKVGIMGILGIVLIVVTGIVVSIRSKEH